MSKDQRPDRFSKPVRSGRNAEAHELEERISQTCDNVTGDTVK